jgi:glutamine cyclotransferase
MIFFGGGSPIVSNNIASRLQRAFYTVNVRMQTQEDTLIIRKKTHTQTSFGQGYATNTSSDVVITEGAGVSRISAYQIDKNNTYKEGDLKVYIPGQLVTESQLENACLIYQEQEWAIVSKLPNGALSRIPVGWSIIARIEK